MKQIPLTRGLFAIVDDEDFEWLNRFKWNAHARQRKGNFEATREFVLRDDDGKMRPFHMGMSVFLMGTRHGYVPDHVNRNSLDNRRVNLRWATRGHNSINWWRNSKYGRGAYANGYGRFASSIYVDKKLIYLGTFDTAAEARNAYDDAAIKYHGVFAMLNRDHFIPKDKT